MNRLPSPAHTLIKLDFDDVAGKARGVEQTALWCVVLMMTGLGAATVLANINTWLRVVTTAVGK